MPAYKNYRNYYEHGAVREASFENDLITIYSKDKTSVYQVRKITDSIFLLCYVDDDGSVYTARILFRCNGASESAIIKAAEYAKEYSIKEIKN